MCVCQIGPNRVNKLSQFANPICFQLICLPTLEFMGTLKEVNEETANLLNAIYLRPVQFSRPDILENMDSCVVVVVKFYSESGEIQ